MEDQTSEASTSQVTAVSQALKSTVWEHFEKAVDDPKTAICKHCRIKVSRQDGSTRGMRRHLERQHPKKWAATNASRTVGDAAAKAFTSELFREQLVQWIVADDQPFTVVEGAAFRELVRLLNPSAKVPSADTIKASIMDAYHQEEDRLREKLQVCFVCLASFDHKMLKRSSFTVDAWTSPNQLPFLGITAHWIDSKWSLQSVLIDFHLLSGPHSGENLAEAFIRSCRRMGILTKINTITMDNATNNARMVQLLEEALLDEGIVFNAADQWLRCLAHVINLAVQAALKALDATADEDDDEEAGPMEPLGAIAKLRKLVVKIRASPQKREKLRNQIEAAKLKQVSPVADVRTRWNSTYAMLERYLREPLHQITSADADLMHLRLTEAEWRTLEEIAVFLKVFADATDHMSGDYPTLTSAILVYNVLIDHVEDTSGETDHRRQPLASTSRTAASDRLVWAASAARAKLCQYYATTEALAYNAAICLDPSKKLQWYEEQRWEKYIQDAAKLQFEGAYKAHYAAPPPSGHSTAPSAVASSFADRMASKRRRETPQDEWGAYQTADTAPDDSDASMPLSWWKAHERVYASLAKMARDMLASPGTSVPIERIFSGGSDLIAPKRCSLSPDTITACMCLKSWRKLK